VERSEGGRYGGHAMIAIAEALAHACPDLLEILPREELVAALFDTDLWLRPAQRVPLTRFGSFGIIAGRGWGKTHGIAFEINRRVEAGEASAIGLMAPTDDRTRDVQVAALVEHSKPWFRATEYRGGVRWPNGVIAEPHTAEKAGRTRSSNFDLAWLTELCDWQHTTRREAFDNITTACRVGRNPTYFWDTTSKGKNEVIQFLLAQHAANPEWHILRRGAMFENPHLTTEYLATEVRKYGIGTRRYDEEVRGLAFNESAGALWKQQWLDDHRVAEAPPERDIELKLHAWDPALSDSPDADEQGSTSACRTRDGHVYILADHSTRETPSVVAERIVLDCKDRGFSGAVLERNHAGNMPRDLITLHAKNHAMKVEVLPREDAAFPRRKQGVIYIREYMTADTKQTRATAPAAAYSRGVVHHVGRLTALELEQTTWEPCSRRSPNRLDAGAYAVAELLEVAIRNKKDNAGAVTGAAKLQDMITRRKGGRLGL